MLLCYKKPFRMSSALMISKDSKAVEELQAKFLLHKSMSFKSLLCPYAHEQLILKISKARYYNTSD